MNISFLFFNRLLAANQAWGGVASLLVLLFSFLAVHAVKLSSKGYALYMQIREKENEKEPAPSTPTVEEKQKKTETAPAPVYYLVEKKRVRKKPAEYEKPKRIQLQNEE